MLRRMDAQFLAAGGHVDLAARAVLALAGPGLGIVLAPPRPARELGGGELVGRLRVRPG
jgi:hypothetical protein